MVKRLVIVAGPSGAGKSTFIQSFQSSSVPRDLRQVLPVGFLNGEIGYVALLDFEKTPPRKLLQTTIVHLDIGNLIDLRPSIDEFFELVAQVSVTGEVLFILINPPVDMLTKTHDARVRIARRALARRFRRAFGSPEGPRTQRAGQVARLVNSAVRTAIRRDQMRPGSGEARRQIAAYRELAQSCVRFREIIVRHGTESGRAFFGDRMLQEALPWHATLGLTAKRTALRAMRKVSSLGLRSRSIFERGVPPGVE
ncbi:MAG: hypothetical protein H6873_10445 [Hyphomicrobiaceae bacterium]|nr:hypothetical protein [Hyphomicrobiaceae bacterium]